MAPTAEEIAKRIAEVRGKSIRRPVLVVATDGAGREVLDYYHCLEHVHGLAPVL